MCRGSLEKRPVYMVNMDHLSNCCSCLFICVWGFLCVSVCVHVVLGEGVYMS